MEHALDAVLLIAPGEPESPDDIKPFIQRVLGGQPVPSSHIEEIARHYEAVGEGGSLVAATIDQARTLERRLSNQGEPLPVFVGMRCSQPWLTDVVQTLAWRGYRHVAALVLSVHRDRLTWSRYESALLEACQACDGPAPAFHHVPSWHDHPLYVEAVVARIAATMADAPDLDPQRTPLLFSAVGLPRGIPDVDAYVAAVADTCGRVARALSWENWSVAYQGRWGQPDESWLEPDVLGALGALADRGHRRVLLACPGFVCDGIDVRYELDIEASELARRRGMHLHRAPTVASHPALIRLLSELVRGLGRHLY